MRKNTILVLLLAGSVLITACWLLFNTKKTNNEAFVSYVANLKAQPCKLYWKNDSNEILGSIKNLIVWLAQKNQKLVFAMNGGMYEKDQSPKGLFIQEGVIISPMDTANGNGNFYLKPNGVFYITEDNKAGICTSPEFVYHNQIRYATQSGPMLVINGNIHPVFKRYSTNLNIRNGVGILPDGKVVFAMSKNEINFYDFALYFKKLGCTDALYLDGFVSRTYLPKKNWKQEDGSFGVMIGITERE